MTEEDGAEPGGKKMKRQRDERKEGGRERERAH